MWDHLMSVNDEIVWLKLKMYQISLLFIHDFALGVDSAASWWTGP